jgi:hypothetical protein
MARHRTRGAAQHRWQLSPQHWASLAMAEGRYGIADGWENVVAARIRRVKACLNGQRHPAEHAAVPVTPA